MAGGVPRRDRRDVRRAIGPALADAVLEHSARIGRAEGVLFRRGFWGRLKWLLFGR